MPRQDPKPGREERTFSPSGGRLLHRIPQAMAMLSMSRSVIYEQIRAGRLRSVTQGRTRLVPDEAIADYIALLVREAKADDDRPA